MAAEEQTDKTIPFFPDHVLTEARVGGVILLVILGIGALGLIFPVGLGPPADPMVTPEHVKPEWYFLALYQILKFIPKTAGVILPILGVILLFALPFLDRKPEESTRGNRIRAMVSIGALALILILTIWGEVS
jgi:quinol-cytochrome oxidoreductase complex cytochrome b subunit